MMSITEDLVSAGILEVVPEPTDNRFQMVNTGSVEVEVGEFLYALVRLIKPFRILETGTYKGVSAMYMALGLRDNGRGSLETIEFAEEHFDEASKLWTDVGVDDLVTLHKQDIREFKTDKEYDMVFLDSEPGMRFDEVVRFFKHTVPGGFILVHDLHHHLSQHPHEKFFGWPYGKIKREMVEWLQDDELRAVSFPTPRGFTLFYKTKADDYRWNKT